MHVPQAEHHTKPSSIYDCLTDTCGSIHMWIDLYRRCRAFGRGIRQNHCNANQNQLLALLRTVTSAAHSMAVLGRLASYCPGSRLSNWGLLQLS